MPIYQYHHNDGSTDKAKSLYSYCSWSARKHQRSNYYLCVWVILACLQKSQECVKRKIRNGIYHQFSCLDIVSIQKGCRYFCKIHIKCRTSIWYPSGTIFYSHGEVYWQMRNPWLFCRLDPVRQTRHHPPLLHTAGYGSEATLYWWAVFYSIFLHAWSNQIVWRAAYM